MIVSILDRRLTEAQALKLASSAAIAVASALVTLKILAYFATGSLSLLSSLLDSASDIVASLGTFIAVRYSLKPADDDHRYGHGKAEAIAAMGTAAFVAGSAALLVVEALSRIVDVQPVHPGNAGIWAMAVSMLLTGLLVLFQTYVVQRTKSQAIAADRLHYKADFAVNGAVLVALWLTQKTGLVLVDAFFAIALAGYLLWAVLPVAREALDVLMDRELDEPQRQRILGIANAHPQVKAVHDLRTRQSGMDVFIEIHLEMDGALTLEQAHDYGVEVEKALEAAFPKANVLFHLDPFGLEEPRLDHSVAAQAPKN